MVWNEGINRAVTPAQRISALFAMHNTLHSRPTTTTSNKTSSTTSNAMYSFHEINQPRPIHQQHPHPHERQPFTYRRNTSDLSTVTATLRDFCHDLIQSGVASSLCLKLGYVLQQQRNQKYFSTKHNYGSKEAEEVGGALILPLSDSSMPQEPNTTSSKQHTSQEEIALLTSILQLLYHVCSSSVRLESFRQIGCELLPLLCQVALQAAEEVTRYDNRHHVMGATAATEIVMEGEENDDDMHPKPSLDDDSTIAIPPDHGVEREGIEGYASDSILATTFSSPQQQRSQSQAPQDADHHANDGAKHHVDQVHSNFYDKQKEGFGVLWSVLQILRSFSKMDCPSAKRHLIYILLQHHDMNTSHDIPTKDASHSIAACGDTGRRRSMIDLIIDAIFTRYAFDPHHCQQKQRRDRATSTTCARLDALSIVKNVSFRVAVDLQYILAQSGGSSTSSSGSDGGGGLLDGLVGVLNHSHNRFSYRSLCETDSGCNRKAEREKAVGDFLSKEADDVNASSGILIVHNADTQEQHQQQKSQPQQPTKDSAWDNKAIEVASAALWNLALVAPTTSNSHGGNDAAHHDVASSSAKMMELQMSMARNAKLLDALMELLNVPINVNNRNVEDVDDDSVSMKTRRNAISILGNLASLEDNKSAMLLHNHKNHHSNQRQNGRRAHLLLFVLLRSARLDDDEGVRRRSIRTLRLLLFGSEERASIAMASKPNSTHGTASKGRDLDQGSTDDDENLVEALSSIAADDNDRDTRNHAIAALASLASEVDPNDVPSKVRSRVIVSLSNMLRTSTFVGGARNESRNEVRTTELLLRSLARQSQLQENRKVMATACPGLLDGVLRVAKSETSTPQAVECAVGLISTLVSETATLLAHHTQNGSNSNDGAAENQENDSNSDNKAAPLAGSTTNDGAKACTTSIKQCFDALVELASRVTVGDNSNDVAQKNAVGALIELSNVNITRQLMVEHENVTTSLINFALMAPEGETKSAAKETIMHLVQNM